MPYLSVSPGVSNIFAHLAECLMRVASSSASPGLEIQLEIQLESRKEAGAPSGGFGGDLAGPEIGEALAVNGEFHEALKLSC